MSTTLMSDEQLTGAQRHRSELDPASRTLLDALTAERAARLDVERKLDEARDCGQEIVCVLSPGCQRHWEERNRELMRERDEARRAMSVCRCVAFTVGHQLGCPLYLGSVYIASPPDTHIAELSVAGSKDAELERLRADARRAAQLLIEQIGAPGPESVVETATRAVAEVERLREEVATLRTGVEYLASELEAERARPVRTVTATSLRYAPATSSAPEQPLPDATPEIVEAPHWTREPPTEAGWYAAIKHPMARQAHRRIAVVEHRETWRWDGGLRWSTPLALPPLPEGE